MTAEPMTTEDLDAMRARVDAHDGPDRYTYTVGGIEYDGHWAHDMRRVLAEVDRLRAELAEQTGPPWSDDALNDAPVTDEEIADTRTWFEAASERSCLGGRWAVIRLLNALQEARAESLKPVLAAAPETPRPPAESHGDGLPAEKRPEGRTGVSETLSDAQVSDSHWLKFNADRQVTGCECGFRADIDSDCGFGDSVVRHLLEVGAEAAVPDVDGWTLRAHPAGFMLSHETDEDRVLTAYRIPVGAVLAFIADQGGRADEC